MSGSIKFYPGKSRESPILIPVADNDVALQKTAHFCRRVRTGAPLLLFAEGGQRHNGPSGGAVTAPDAVDRIASALDKATKYYGLALIPMVAIGSMAGADLVARLVLRHPSLLGGCVLLRPTTPTLRGVSQTLIGFDILLGRTLKEEQVGSAGWQVYDALLKAGASVVCERVPDGSSLGIREAAMTRVFVATLFGQ